jgi:hypothetical protein
MSCIAVFLQMIDKAIVPQPRTAGACGKKMSPQQGHLTKNVHHLPQTVSPARAASPKP